MVGTAQATPLCIIQAMSAPTIAVSEFPTYCSGKGFGTGTVYDDSTYTGVISAQPDANLNVAFTDPTLSKAIKCIYGEILSNEIRPYFYNN